MTTDPKEAAVQRLAAAFRAASTLPIMGEPIEVPDLDELARIAIEQAVVPVAGNIHHPKAIHGYLGCSACESGSTIPWDAVCAEQQP